MKGLLTVLPLGAGLPDSVTNALDWLAVTAGGHCSAARAILPGQALTSPERLAIAAAPDRCRAVIALQAQGVAGPLLVIGPAGVRPHCWHLPNGVDYALVPEDASVAVVAHELGHLLFGWPDMRLPTGCSIACLMAPIGSTTPARPSAAMRVTAGWETPAALRPGMRPDSLAEGCCFSWAGLLIERQGDRIAGFASTGRAVSLAFVHRIAVTDSCTLALASRFARTA